MMSLFAAVASLQLFFLPAPPQPDLDLNSIRKIECTDGIANRWSGTGFVIHGDTLVTALHVARGGICVDAETHEPLIHTYSDEAHDFAMMTGDYAGYQPVRYSCQRYRTGVTHYSIGHRNGQFRYNRMVPTVTYTDDRFLVGGDSRPGMRHLRGTMAQGTSGGPVIDEYGIAHGINNVTDVVTHREAWSYELADTVLCRSRVVVQRVVD